MKSTLLYALAMMVLSAAAASSQVLFDHLGTAPSEFSANGALTLNGSAQRTDTALRLTPALRTQGGSAWLDEKQNVLNGFSTMFQFQITDRRSAFDKSVTEDTGGDGFAFVIQNSGPDALGGRGAAMGYAGIPNSLAIEFDTWDNNESGQVLLRDPDDNHISVQTRGTETNSEFTAFSLGLTPNLPELSDGEVHTAKIEYVPGTLLVYVDDLELPILAVKVDLATLLALDEGRAWVGFTAATWDAYENHDILNWAFNGAGR
jgi:hypothetical protein